MRNWLVRSIDKSLLTPIEGALRKRGKCAPWLRAKPLKNRFSLVVPCYNVAQYIDEFLRSVSSQTVGQTNLEVILVDDGSTDSTTEIAQAWAAKCPGWVRYHRQTNMGLCGARNAGLSLATGEWVSFPDPDDFLHHRYLETVDRFLFRLRNSNVSLVCCNFVRYLDESKQIKNNHGLKFRFQSGEQIVSAAEMDDMMQLAANSAFMRREKIDAFSLRFNPLIVPGFEDAELVNRYLIRQPETLVGFLPKAIYYYRKRADQSSLQDTAKTKKEFYLSQPRHGWLPVLADAKEIRGTIPKFIQRTVLYDTIGHFRTHLKAPHTLDLLSEDEKHQYKQIMADAFKSIDPELVAETELPGLFEDLRVGILNHYFGARRDVTNAYITHYDEQKKLMRVAVYTPCESDDPRVLIDERETPHLFRKWIRHTFVGDPFFYEIAFWVPVTPGFFTIRSASGPIRFRINGHSFEEGLSSDDIQREFATDPTTVAATKYDGAWLFMDRTDKGDDNAEHFYRYLKGRRDGRRIYFILYRSSPDWKRLEEDGFDLIEFRSKDHLDALRGAKYLISSHGDSFIRAPFKSSELKGAKYRFIFIQHGVTKDNQADWFNTIAPALLATATKAEFKSIVDERSDYRLTEKEVFLTGFPRHDALQRLKLTRRTVFIMPTWRGELTGRLVRPGLRDVKPGFERTDYVRTWSSLLNSPNLQKIADEHGLKIVFCPHPNFVRHLDAFSVPPHIETLRPDEIRSLQPHFAEMAVMVTDYSSVAFDAGCIDKPVVYYQFDQERFISGHIYRTGYFDYAEHGFGPIALTEASTINYIEKAVRGEEDPIYAQRRLQTFPFRDGKSSERLLHAIESLDVPIGFGSV